MVREAIGILNSEIYGSCVPLVSVIVPVYQTAPESLRDCIASVYKQRGVPLELIVVLDGIQEAQRQTIGDFCACTTSDDLCVKLIEQDHCGVSAARNAGMREARAKWICFLDSDDLLENDGLYRLCMAGEKADMVVGDYNVVLGHKTYPHHYLPKGRVFEAQDNPEDKRQLLRDVLNPQSGLGFCWGKLFLREKVLAAGIYFDERLSLGEDVNFVLHYAAIAARVCCVPSLVYRYNTYPDSAVRGFRLNYRERSEMAMQVLGCALAEIGYGSLLYKEYQSCVLYHFLLITINDSFHPKRVRKEGLIHSIKEYSKLTKRTMYRTAIREGSPKAFSFTRKVTVWLIRLKNYPLTALVAYLRHRQRSIGT